MIADGSNGDVATNSYHMYPVSTTNLLIYLLTYIIIIIYVSITGRRMSDC